MLTLSQKSSRRKCNILVANANSDSSQMRPNTLQKRSSTQYAVIAIATTFFVIAKVQCPQMRRNSCKCEVHLVQPMLANANHCLQKRGSSLRGRSHNYEICSRSPALVLNQHTSPMRKLIRNTSKTHPSPSGSKPNMHTSVITSYELARAIKSPK